MSHNTQRFSRVQKRPLDEDRLLRDLQELDHEVAEHLAAMQLAIDGLTTALAALDARVVVLEEA